MVHKALAYKTKIKHFFLERERKAVDVVRSIFQMRGIQTIGFLQKENQPLN